METDELRQQLLILHCGSTDPQSATVAWALYDGAAPAEASQMRTGDGDEPPYPSVLAAMREGWRVLQFPQPSFIPGREHETAGLSFEFVLSREVPRHG